MAFTVSKTEIVFGNKRGEILDITADAATQTVQTTLKTIHGFMVGIQSATTAGFKVYHNSSASGIATPGSLGISGVATGDRFFITVFGV